MNRLQKFVEQGTYGEKPGRTAYVIDADNLPAATAGHTWKPVRSFSAADEVMAEPGLKEVFLAAVRNGVAVVDRRKPDPL